MKNEKEIFDLFVDANNMRPFFTAPFSQNGYVCASDGIALIRVDNRVIEGEYPLYEKTDCSRFFVETKKEVEITVQQLEKLLSEVELIEEFVEEGADIECEECEGSGEVVWEYKRWEHEDDCPLCDGSGYISRKRSVPTGKKIPDMSAKICLGDKKLKAHYIDTLVKTMELTGMRSVIMKYNEGKPYEQALFAFNGNVDVLLMPYL